MKELPNVIHLLIIILRVNSQTSRSSYVVVHMEFICSIFLSNDGITLETRRVCLDYTKLLYI